MAYTIISQNNTTTTLSDENGNVITVPARVTLATSTDYTIIKVNNNSVDLEDGNGKIIRGVPACVVLAGEGGGDQHNLGYYATQAALEEAYPTAEAGDWAIVGATDTVWIWDEDTSAWVDSDTKGQVESVNGKTGVVQLNALDVDGLVQISQLSDKNQLPVGTLFQYTGTETTESTTVYRNGWFYLVTVAHEAGLEQTKVGSFTYTIDEETYMSYAQPTSATTYRFKYNTGAATWKLSIGGSTETPVDIADYGITIDSGNLTNSSMIFVTYYETRLAVASQKDVQGGIKTCGAYGIQPNQWSNHQATSINMNIEQGNMVFVAPDPAVAEEWTRCGVRITDDYTNGQIHFVCDITPESYLNYNYVVLVASSGTYGNWLGAMDTTKSQYIQYATMPTASVEYLGKIVQYTGATDATYTNGYFYKGVSDGQDPATYSWEEVEVQAGGGGSSLPDQTGQSGKFLTTDGTDASWSDKPLVNNTTNTNALAIGASSIGLVMESTAVGALSVGYGRYGTALGKSATAKYKATALGANTTANDYAIQLGQGGTNSDAGTMKVALTTSSDVTTNYELMSADGTIPAARHASLPAADGTYVLKLVIASGVPTLSWVAE